MQRSREKPIFVPKNIKMWSKTWLRLRGLRTGEHDTSWAPHLWNPKVFSFTAKLINLTSNYIVFYLTKVKGPFSGQKILLFRLPKHPGPPDVSTQTVRRPPSEVHSDADNSGWEKRIDKHLCPGHSNGMKKWKNAGCLTPWQPLENIKKHHKDNI